MRISVISPLLAAAAVASIARASSLQRDRDPVVILGSSLEPLLGEPVDLIVAFRYEGGWQQIPVQVDERKFVEYRVVYNSDLAPAGLGTVAYTDTTTYTGADVDPNFDGDDELALMARDAGDRADHGIGLPAGVRVSTGLEIGITDPLDAGEGFVYLFCTDGALSPDAGQDYVAYTFNLLAGDYIPNYNTLSGPNPEDSEVSSASYRTHFSDRWIRDEINILTVGASGVDVLDRHRNMFAPGNCARSEYTFSNGEGAFFTNRDGPVRAIRSYMGANSGPFTQREHVFYEQRQDLTTFLRVHAISGVMDLYDYSPDATGMSYFNDLNQAGVPVDGQPDVVTAGPITWEMVTGAQGSLIMSHRIETDIEPFPYSSYYSDDLATPVAQCEGDAFEYATSGLWVDHSIPNTDPWQGAYDSLAVRRTVYYESPGETVGMAQLRDAQARVPLEVVATPYVPPPGDFDGDGDVDLEDFGHFQVCLSGSGIPQADPDCQDANLDGDNDVDQGDFSVFQACISGPDVAANPDCAAE